MSQLSESSRIDAVEVDHKSLGTWEIKLDIVIVGKYRRIADSFRYSRKEGAAKMGICESDGRIESAVYLFPILERQAEKALSSLFTFSTTDRAR